MLPLPTNAVQQYANPPIRKWTVPAGDCVAAPTADFYRDEWTWLTNEGNATAPRWVALDRYNGVEWREKRCQTCETNPVWIEIRATQELACARNTPVGQTPAWDWSPPDPIAKRFARRLMRPCDAAQLGVCIILLFVAVWFLGYL